MTDKIIKNEQWTITELIARIKKAGITKPKFQRKKKWTKVPNKKKTAPNDRAYIEFLFEHCNSVAPITFGQETINNELILSNIDGNNRINAISNFISRPFEIYGDLLEDINNYIGTLEILSIDEQKLLIDIISKLSYDDIMNFQWNKYFNQIGQEDFYNSKLKGMRDDFDDKIQDIQDNLKINKSRRFDEHVKINVNIFYEYSTNDLCNIFQNINQYNTKLTEFELLSSRLYNVTEFVITDEKLHATLICNINEYYKKKSEDEVLQCYTFDKDHSINTHDFMVGFQNLSHDEYNFIEETNVEGLSLFYKLFKSIYGDLEGNTFTTEHINDFINRIQYSCRIFDKVCKKIYTEDINDKLFNSACGNKIKTLKKNNMYVIFSCLIGYYMKHTSESIVMKEIEKGILYHFMVGDIKDKEKRDKYRPMDSILYEAGGAYIDGVSKTMLSHPDKISIKITRKNFSEVISELTSQYNVPCERFLETGKKKFDKRRPIPFWAKTLYFYYYKEKIPVNMLDNTFSVEHIFPNSSEWNGALDKDRVGNLIPIIASMNCSRGNKNIDEYNKTQTGRDFFKNIKDIIPTRDEYNITVRHEDRIPYINNNDKYDEICSRNENFYRINFMNILFK